MVSDIAANGMANNINDNVINIFLCSFFIKLLISL
jgi:hypothetical protein